MKNHLIKEFAQETLGCGCPEEVFSHIEHSKGKRLKGGLVLRDRIVIGKRLLVYVYESADGEGIQDSVIRVLLTAGVRERDKNGFNRFRIALLTKDPAGDRDLSERAAQVIGEFDDRTFVHTIARDSISF